jgi:thymidylate kinase
MPKPRFKVITIREETAQKLAELKRELEKEAGKPVSYDAVLRFILARAAEKLERLSE